LREEFISASVPPTSPAQADDLFLGTIKARRGWRIKQKLRNWSRSANSRSGNRSDRAQADPRSAGIRNIGKPSSLGLDISCAARARRRCESSISPLPRHRALSWSAARSISRERR